MDDQKSDVNPIAEEEVSETPSSSVESKAPEEEFEPEAEAESTEEAKAEGEETKKEVPKKGAESRIRELNARAKTAEEKAQSLSQKLEELTGGVPSAPQVPYKPQAEPGAEITPEQYSQDVLKQADALVQLRLSQQRIVDNINKEADQAVKLYPELDPDNKETFNKELSDSITEATMAYVVSNKANPNLSVKKFVERLMKPYKASLEKEVAVESEKTTKQISEAALRPTPSSKSEKKFADLTPEEMEKRLGVVY